MIKIGDLNFEGPWLKDSLPDWKKTGVFVLIRYTSDGESDVLAVGKIEKSLSEATALIKKDGIASGTPSFVAAYSTKNSIEADELAQKLKDRYLSN